MKISIAIPTYIKDEKDLSYLTICLDSIVEQSFTDYEVVVSDNSTNDLAKNLCEDYIDKFNLIYEKNLEYVGMSANSNYVMDLCRGEYIKILHCDDLLFSQDALKIIVDSLDNSDKYWLVNSFNHTYDSVNYFDTRIPQYPEHLLVGNNLLGCPTNVTIRNKDIEYFDTNVSLSMDHEWYHRLRIKHGVPLIINDVLTTGRQHPNNATSKINYDIIIEGDGTSWQFIQGELEYLQKKYKDFFDSWEYPE